MLVIVKKIYKTKRETPKVHTCTFEKQTHLAKSSWKMPKHLMLVFHANSLRLLSNPRVALLHKFYQDQTLPSSFSGVNRPLASLYDLKSRKFHLVIHQSVTIHCHPSNGACDRSRAISLDLQGCRERLSNFEHNKYLFELLPLNCPIIRMHVHLCCPVTWRKTEELVGTTPSPRPKVSKGKWQQSYFTMQYYFPVFGDLRASTSRYWAHDRQVIVLHPAQDIKEALLGGIWSNLANAPDRASSIKQ